MLQRFAVSAVVFMIAFMIYVGCKSPYPPCDAAGVYRCNGNVVELCNGDTWHPRTDCGNIWFEGEVKVQTQCVESGTIAECDLKRDV